MEIVFTYAKCSFYDVVHLNVLLHDTNVTIVFWQLALAFMSGNAC